MRGRRGFVNYDIWIVLAVLALVAAVVIPAVIRGVRRARGRRDAARALVTIAAAERAAYERTGAYLDSLPAALPAGIRLVSLRADSAGWSAAVTGDSLHGVALVCGMFEGSPALAPDSSVTQPGRIGCW